MKEGKIKRAGLLRNEGNEKDRFLGSLDVATRPGEKSSKTLGEVQNRRPYSLSGAPRGH